MTNHVRRRAISFALASVALMSACSSSHARLGVVEGSARLCIGGAVSVFGGPPRFMTEVTVQIAQVGGRVLASRTVVDPWRFHFEVPRGDYVVTTPNGGANAVTVAVEAGATSEVGFSKICR